MQERARFHTELDDGQLHYSDGHIEEEILKRLQSGESEEQILRSGSSWPVYYHFSPQRHNLLSWVDFREGESLLEVGAGWGALTGLFCKRGLRVSAAELSRLRSEILWARHARYENLNVFVGNLNEMDFSQPFRYATLIGVLEYCGRYSETEKPFEDFLRAVYARLMPGGTLFLAIENPTGIKYFAGAKEDHYARPFVSIEGYGANAQVQTFSQDELKRMLAMAGFLRIDAYYPMPDYKLPQCVVSADVPELFELAAVASPSYDKGEFRVFDEARALQNLIRQNLFPVFCNSLLLAAHKGGEQA